jgi:hypothetical protein
LHYTSECESAAAQPVAGASSNLVGSRKTVMSDFPKPDEAGLWVGGELLKIATPGQFPLRLQRI